MIELFATASEISGELVTSFISSIGFPIFVAVWMLYKGHKDSEQMKEAINGLENAILELKSLIGGEKK